jgi:hypothetical protein
MVPGAKFLSFFSPICFPSFLHIFLMKAPVAFISFISFIFGDDSRGVLFSSPHVTYDSAMSIGKTNDHRLVLDLRINSE